MESAHLQKYVLFFFKYIPNKPGNFIDYTKGAIVGTHEGVHHFTLGQRSKLGGCSGPLMVFRKNLETDDIFVVRLKSILFFNKRSYGFIHILVKEKQIIV